MKHVLLLLLLAGAVPVSAQPKPNAMQKRAMASEEGAFIQLTGFGSFNLGKDLYQAGGAQLGLDDNGGWGGRVAYFTNPKLGFELSYARTSGDLKVREGDTAFPNPPELGDSHPGRTSGARAAGVYAGGPGAAGGIAPHAFGAFAVNAPAAPIASLTVSLADRSYPIRIGDGLLRNRAS